MLEKNDVKEGSAFNRLKAVSRLMICLFFAVVFYFLVPPNSMKGFTHILFAWDIFSLFTIVATWVTFFTTTPQQMRNLARVQDETRTTIFIIVLISTFASLLAVLLLLT